MAVVQVHSGSWVLRDYADVSHPQTPCVFTRAYVLQVADARHVVVAVGANLFAGVDLPEVAYHWFQLPDQVPSFVGVASSLDEVAWLSADLSAGVDRLHLTTAAGDRVVGVPLPNPHGGRCGSPEDSKPVGYTRSGKLLAVLDQPVPSLNSLLVVEGDQTLFRLVPNGTWPPGNYPAFALLSPTTEALYYRQGDNVFRWTRGQGGVTFLSGVVWSYPSISPDGRHLA
ncbi:MAG TPA: hypothetical protein VK131_02880, partial [Candidatus Acidoferrales bacterium]|nr:hypothetical protein [Candidatus Acidoferrales bacterium]